MDDSNRFKKGEQPSVLEDYVGELKEANSKAFQESKKRKDNARDADTKINATLNRLVSVLENLTGTFDIWVECYKDNPPIGKLGLEIEVEMSADGFQTTPEELKKVADSNIRNTYNTEEDNTTITFTLSLEGYEPFEDILDDARPGEYL